MALATVIMMQRLLRDHRVRMQPPTSSDRNCTAPPGICRYCVPRVEKSKELTIMEVNWVLLDGASSFRRMRSAGGEGATRT